MQLLSARIQSYSLIEILFSDPVDSIDIEKIQLDGLEIENFGKNNHSIFLTVSKIDLTKQYSVYIHGIGGVKIRPDKVLDIFNSEKAFGCNIVDHQYIFRVFSPTAHRVQLCLFDSCQSDKSRDLEMGLCEPGIWEYCLNQSDAAPYYGYRVYKSSETHEPPVIIDPYSKAVCTINHYLNPGKTLLHPPDDFDWEEDTWVCPKLEDLIIYEMHVRDFTTHPSSGVPDALKGSYPGIVHDGATSGLNYLKNLGINAVELMPVQEFANIEPEFRNPNQPVYNRWNPYNRNHWGYMTTCFFSPESYYATGSSPRLGEVNGRDGRAVTELKQMVKTLHQNGITVILDVVYNHISQYDLNPLRMIDEDYYLRKDGQGYCTSESGCGNDLKTERPMVQRMIVDSILYWMTEYHIDGFRFDLASLIDNETLDEMTHRARDINPNVILIAEPWGGGHYGQRPFSDRNWASWNDMFRNGIKGAHPKHQGFILGAFHEGDHTDTIKTYIQGTTVEQGGPFHKAGHSINYLESHDDYTLGDFIRLALGKFSEQKLLPVDPMHPQLNDFEMRLHKLAAFILFTSRGAVMIHEGQEYARSKTIVKENINDPKTGLLDQNSYNKDNATNWMDFSHVQLNRILYQYYCGLIKVRMQNPLLRDDLQSIHFLECDNAFGVGYILHDTSNTLLILMNSHQTEIVTFSVPTGPWDVLVDADKASPNPERRIHFNRISLKPISEMLCLKINDPKA